MSEDKMREQFNPFVLFGYGFGTKEAVASVKGFDEGVKACAAIKDAEIAELKHEIGDWKLTADANFNSGEAVIKQQKVEIAARDLMIKELREALIKSNDPYSNLGTCITEALAKSEHHNSRALEKKLLEARIDELKFTQAALSQMIARRVELQEAKLAELNNKE